MAKDLTIPERLQWLLKQRGVSQNALARVAKVSPQTVANTLHHGRLPQSKTTAKFARTLGVPTSVFTAKSMNDDQLRSIITKGGPFSFSDGAKSSTGTAKKSTKSKPKAKAVRKPAAKKAPARKLTAKKPVAKKTTAKKTVARKPAAKKTVAAKRPATKTTAKKRPAAKRAVAKRPVAKTATKRPVAKRAATTRGSRTIVRHAAAAKRGGSTRTTSRTAGRSTKAAPSQPLRGGSRNGVATSIDFNAIVTKLQKLANSRSEQVSLDACKALLALR